jgi:hypothetical protein
VSEELAGGPAGRSSRWPRVAGGVALAALVGLGGWQASHTGRDRPPPTAAPTDTGFPQPTLAGPAPLPTDFTALPPAGRTGVRLIVAVQDLTEVDLDSGARRPVAGIPAAGTGYRLERDEQGTVLVQAAQSCPGCPHVAYLLPAGSLTAVRLPGFDGVAPAAQSGRLWAYRVAVPDRPGIVQMVDLAGRPQGPAYPLPADRAVLRGTVAGLLTVRCCDSVELWDPRTDRRLRGFQRVIAAAADRLAWVPDACTFDCAVMVSDLSGGPEHHYRLHAAGLGVCATFFPTGFGRCAAFSPDGATLAIIAHRDVAGAGGLPARDVYLLRGGAVTRVRIRPGVVLPDISLALGWSGRRLVLATAGPGTRVRAPALLLATATLDEPELQVIQAPGLAGRAVEVR